MSTPFLQVALELGTYIGYSAIATARRLPPGGKLYGIDPNAMHVQVAREMIQHAGLSDKVEIIQGVLETSIPVSLPEAYMRACCHHCCYGLCCYALQSYWLAYDQFFALFCIKFCTKSLTKSCDASAGWFFSSTVSAQHAAADKRLLLLCRNSVSVESRL